MIIIFKGMLCYYNKQIPACRYEKGAWSECVAGKMNRVDKLRPNNGAEANGAVPAVCEPTRNVQKNCNAAKKAERKQKDKGELLFLITLINSPKYNCISCIIPGGRKGRA